MTAPGITVGWPSGTSIHPSLFLWTWIGTPPQQLLLVYRNVGPRRPHADSPGQSPSGQSSQQPSISSIGSSSSLITQAGHVGLSSGTMPTSHAHSLGQSPIRQLCPNISLVPLKAEKAAKREISVRRMSFMRTYRRKRLFGLGALSGSRISRRRSVDRRVGLSGHQGPRKHKEDEGLHPSRPPSRISERLCTQVSFLEQGAVSR
jgi:hypothetical protein